MKQERSKLERLDELIQQLQNGSLDGGATADITEVLEELNADLRARLDMNEYEKGFNEV
jgi:hypothetical protein